MGYRPCRSNTVFSQTVAASRLSSIGQIVLILPFPVCPALTSFVILTLKPTSLLFVMSTTFHSLVEQDDEAGKRSTSVPSYSRNLKP